MYLATEIPPGFRPEQSIVPPVSQSRFPSRCILISLVLLSSCFSSLGQHMASRELPRSSIPFRIDRSRVTGAFLHRARTRRHIPTDSSALPLLCYAYSGELVYQHVCARVAFSFLCDVLHPSQGWAYVMLSFLFQSLCAVSRTHAHLCHSSYVMAD